MHDHADLGEPAGRFIGAGPDSQRRGRCGQLSLHAGRVRQRSLRTGHRWRRDSAGGEAGVTGDHDDGRARKQSVGARLQHLCPIRQQHGVRADQRFAQAGRRYRSLAGGRRDRCAVHVLVGRPGGGLDHRPDCCRGARPARCIDPVRRRLSGNGRRTGPNIGDADVAAGPCAQPPARTQADRARPVGGVGRGPGRSSAVRRGSARAERDFHGLDTRPEWRLAGGEEPAGAEPDWQ